VIAQEEARKRARGFRYKKPVCRDLCMESIRCALSDMEEEAGEIDGMLWDDDTLEELLGDEDEAFEFKMAFRDLQSDLQSMAEALQELDRLMYTDDAEELFDLFFPAVGGDGATLYGYDEYESDYFPLDSWEAEAATREAAKKLKRLTKEQLLDTAGVCLRIARQFLALQYRHDCLSAAFDILRGQQEGLLQLVRKVEEAWAAADRATDGFRNDWGSELWELDRVLSNVPERLWVE